MMLRVLLLAMIINMVRCASHDRNSGVTRVPAGKVPEREIPILCYHNIKSELDHHAPELTVTDSVFHVQLKMLHDSGYHTITADQLYNYLTKGSPLPSKPVMLSFDDSHEEHFSVADQEMKKYGFRGVFFVETIVLDKPNYLTRQEVKTLADEGNTIACHTYDHPLVTKLQDDQWQKELDQPRELLKQITGKPVDYFAYPYGAWNERALEEVKKRDIKLAFQLADKQSVTYPLLTIRRIMVSDKWSVTKLGEEIRDAFNKKLLAYAGTP